MISRILTSFKYPPLQPKGVLGKVVWLYNMTNCDNICHPSAKSMRRLEHYSIGAPQSNHMSEFLVWSCIFNEPVVTVTFPIMPICHKNSIIAAAAL